MKISIVLPVKGWPKFLRQALLSILLQGYEHYEVVIQDCGVDAPVTAEGEVRRILGLFDGRERIYVERDRGIFDGVNRGLHHASGDVFYFMCSDDLLVPGSLEGVVEALRNDRFGGPRWLYGKTISADVTGKPLGVDGEPVTYAQLLEHNRIGQPAVFWNRQLMDLAGVFDPRYRHAADYDLWLRFWGYVEPVFLNQELGVHRHHDGQNTRVYANATENEAKRISTRYRNFGPLLQRARNEFQARRAYAGASSSDLDGWFGRT